MIRLVDHVELLLAVKAMDMATPHLGRRENTLLASKKKKILVES